MEVRFYIDPGTGQPHIYNHGVNEDETEYVLRHPGEDRPAADGSRMAIGQTESGRYLRIIYIPNPENKEMFVITGYELSGKQLMAYRRRRRKKGK